MLSIHQLTAGCEVFKGFTKVTPPGAREFSADMLFKVQGRKPEMLFSKQVKYFPGYQWTG
jgi:hypothetical protein